MSANRSHKRHRSTPLVFVLVTLAGMAALSWEILWQIQASLALGVSALGTAITLACTMGGMTCGALLAGRVLARRPVDKPLQVYGLLEASIGLSGLFLLPGMSLLADVDVAIYHSVPSLAPVTHVLGIALLLGVPTLAMGATIPVFGLIAKKYRTHIAVLYGLNTGGAAVGTVLMAFIVLPSLGVSLTIDVVATLNLCVCAGAWVLPSWGPSSKDEDSLAGQAEPTETTVSWRLATFIVFVTGFATFALEVAWFRSLRATFQACSDSFAIILTSVIVPLAIAAHLAPIIRRRKWSLGGFIAAAAVLVLVANPFIERFDLLATREWSYLLTRIYWLAFSLAIVGPPVLLLGVAVPTLLEEQSNPDRLGKLYGINTIGAIVGALVAGWILLPTIGTSATGWLVGVVVGVSALPLIAGKRRWIAVTAVLAALTAAVVTRSGLGRDRIQGHFNRRSSVANILAYDEGPDATISVIDRENGVRSLVIDGFVAADQQATAHYMAWMGRLPALAHPAPEKGLVICFGTGQTANAVRQEGIKSLDIVELSAEVLSMAGYFPKNRNVLRDERVNTIVMDGRAWLRRSRKAYDLVTLEPMPPLFAGSNALYSREFYELIDARLRPGGTVAQWLPYHLVTPYYSASIAATFHAVFPDSILWVDPRSAHGILIGRSGTTPGETEWFWPGLGRHSEGRTLAPFQVLGAVRLSPEGISRYAALGTIITDDNQLLSYGGGLKEVYNYGTRDAIIDHNLEVVEQIREGRLSRPSSNR